MRRSIVVASLGLGSAACPSVPADEMPAVVEVPEAVQRAFDRSCAEAECHDATTQAGGLVLDAQSSQAIIEGPSSQSDLVLVRVGSLSESYMAVKLLPEAQLPAGVVRHEEPMPLGGYGEGDVDSVNTILSWIAGHGPSGGGDDSADTEATSTGGGTEGGVTGDDGGSTSDDGGPVGDDGGPSYPRCSVEGVTAGEVSNPLDKGDEAGRFPLVVGEALEANCGCHTLANRNLNTELPGLLAPGGTLFLEYADMSRPAGGTTLGLLIEEAVFGSFSMPPGSCPAMSSDDTAVLQAWFDQGLPDGADFNPP